MSKARGVAFIGLITLAICIPATISAQANDTAVMHKRGGPRVTLDKEQKELYSGIIPGTRDDLKHLDAKSKKYNQLDWIGFAPEETRTRVFIKATPNISYDMSRSEDGTQIILTFDDTIVENYNLMRFIDTSPFKRTVKRIEAKRKRKVVTVTMTVEPGASPSTSQNGEYIYFDFPHSSDSES